MDKLIKEITKYLDSKINYFKIEDIRELKIVHDNDLKSCYDYVARCNEYNNEKINDLVQCLNSRRIHIEVDAGAQQILLEKGKDYRAMLDYVLKHTIEAEKNIPNSTVEIEHLKSAISYLDRLMQCYAIKYGCE
jgi:hypothetical protein